MTTLPTKYTVEPIIGEIGRYRINSSRAGQHHIVDIVDVECSCIGWSTRARKHFHATGELYRCVHLRRCSASAYNHLIETMRRVRVTPSRS